jgi:hypothetical protein
LEASSISYHSEVENDSDIEKDVVKDESESSMFGGREIVIPDN